MKTAEKKKFIENLTSLYLLLGANYIIPIFTFPYLVRVLGTETFGMLAFVSAFISYFVTFTDYGFNLSATRQVSLNRSDRTQLSKIFSSVLVIKIGLLMISVAIILPVVLLVPRFHPLWKLCLVSSMAILGNVLFPVWLFQGMERMKLFAVINIVARLITTAGIFIFVRRPEDFLLAAFLQCVTVILAGLLSMIVIDHYWKLRFHLPCISDIRFALVDGWYVFISMLSSTLFNNTNVFILGMLTDNTTVGVYTIAEKAIRIVINLTNPVTTAIYPKVSLLFNESHAAAISFLRKVALWGGGMFLLMSATTLLGARLLTMAITGSDNVAITNIIRLLSVLPFTIFIDNIYGTQILLNIGRSRYFMRSILCAGVFSVIGSFIAIPMMGAMGSAIVFLTSELLVLALYMQSVHTSQVSLLLAMKQR